VELSFDKSYIFLLIIFSLFGCSDSEPLGEISYNDQIQESIFIFSCRTAACHDASSAGGLDLTSYATLIIGGNSGSLIRPGAAEESPLIWSIEGRDQFGSLVSIMPPTGLPTLTRSEINIIKDWIDQGAKDN